VLRIRDRVSNVGGGEQAKGARVHSGIV